MQIVGIVVVAGGAVFAFLLLHWLARRIARPRHRPPPGGFSFGDTKRLHLEGKISDDEYQRLDAAIAKAKQNAPKPSICPKCGYDLRATPDRCPECGEETQY
jgi:hypothetical protein